MWESECVSLNVRRLFHWLCVAGRKPFGLGVSRNMSQELETVDTDMESQQNSPKHSPAIVMVCNAGTENGAGKGTDPALSHDPASFDYRATTRLIIPTRRDARLKRARQRTIIQCPVSSRSEFRLPHSLSLSPGLGSAETDEYYFG